MFKSESQAIDNKLINGRVFRKKNIRMYSVLFCIVQYGGKISIIFILRNVGLHIFSF